MKMSVALSKKMASEWLRMDPDPTTRKEIQDLLDKNQEDELDKRLNSRISFGTAGLRARMEAGFTRINMLTIIQTTQGLGHYILATAPDAKEKGIVIGYDARHNSQRFASLTKDCLLRLGIKVYLFSDVVHTPLVPFTVDMKGAAAGIMITASHNPKQDNGYKVYWANGVQIIPPHDIGIAKSIEDNLEVSTVQFDAHADLLELLDEITRDAYAQNVQKLVPKTFKVPSFVYTPLHGVGFVALSNVLKPFNCELPVNADGDGRISSPMIVVPEQIKPDPDFPTVKFPNPEERGALDIAKRIADSNAVSIILANDPDADRLAVAEKLDHSGMSIQNGTSLTDHWHQFTGNELGVLLASHVMDETSTSIGNRKQAFLNSTVSTGMLRVMAESRGHYSAETLTGFKWLGNIARQLESQGYEVHYAFEEALGYMFPSVVHDKDGIAAAIVFLYAVAKWQNQGFTPWQKLQQLYKEYGFFVEANTYLISPSANVTNSLFSNIRSSETPHPSHIGKFRILRWRDLTVGYDSATEDHKPELPTDPNSQMITCELDQKVRFTVRGSGTEPKIKIYVECQADDWHEADKTAKVAQYTIIQEWFKPQQHGLQVAS